MKKILTAVLAAVLLCGFAMAAGDAAEEANFVGMANPWQEASSGEIAEQTGLQLVIPDGVEAVCSYMEGLAQADWEADGVAVTERVSAAIEEPVLDSEALTEQSGLYFTGMQTQSKELTVGGRCPGYMEFQKGSFGGIIWYDEDAGALYTISMDPISDPKQLGDAAELISPARSDESENSMIVIDGCAIAHDLTAVPVDEIDDTADYLWKVTDGYGITYTDKDGTVWGIFRAGQAGEFEIVVSAEDDPSPWTVDGHIWVGGSKLVQLCVEDGVLTYTLTDELQSGESFDAEIVTVNTGASSGEASAE